MFNEIKRVIKIGLLLKRNKAKSIKLSIHCNPSLHCTFGGFNRIGAFTAFEGAIGYGSYLGENCSINGSIGKYCSIGHNVVTLIGNHPTHIFVSTSPCFYSTKKQNGLSYVDHEKYDENRYADVDNQYGIIIGNDVWVGYGATLIGGITIGDGAIIGSRAFVNKSVPPYAIVAGIPGKIIGYRFDDETIKYLQELEWWNKPIEWIKSNADYFENVELLMKHIGDRIDEATN